MKSSKKKELDPESPIRFDQEHGRIYRDNHRMLMFSTRAIGMLRTLLNEELGKDQARIFLKRFGYSAGMTDGFSLKISLADESPQSQIKYGLSFQALQGVTKFVEIAERTKIDLEQNKFHWEADAFSSYEAEQHLEMFSTSEKPVCWTIVGYLAGYFTATLGKKVLVVEHNCLAMGNEGCRFSADFEESLSAGQLAAHQDYQAMHLPHVFDDLQKTIMQQQQYLQEKQKTIIQLQSKLHVKEKHEFSEILGESQSLSKAIAMARLAAPVDSTVLLLGESGTGKELLARGIHKNSQRADKPFIAVDCSALPETLQEAELFGHKKGAFTGATDDHIGLFESADNGTLLLDEVGDLTLVAQTKLLRALQESEIRRIGETNVRKINVRIIAATNKDLEKMVQQQTFRADLYYRLNVVSITLPPLHERENDSLLLADHFFKKFSSKFSKRGIRGISREAKRAIMLYSWPGNVRELKNAIERAVILSSASEIELAELPEKIAETYYYGKNGEHTAPQKLAGLQSFADELTGIKDESEQLRMALNLVKGNREKAAALLGISRTTLWRRMQRLKQEQD